MVPKTEASMTDPPPPQQIVAFSGPTSRLPQFYKNNPELWFRQMDAIFAASRTTTSSQIKFQAAVTALDEEVLTQMEDLFTTESADPYKALRDRLTSVYGLTDARRIQKLLEETTLGSQKPSQLYRQMQHLAGSLIDATVLRNLWLRSLPPRVQEVLAGTKDLSIDDLTRTADNVVAIAWPSEVSAVAGVRASPQPSTSGDPGVSALLEEVRNLRVEVAALRDRNQQQPGRQRTRNRPGTEGGLCHYHRKFGRNARKCAPPCTWKPLNK